jgi:hypothetical protein
MLTAQAEAIKELMRDVPVGRLGGAEEIADAVGGFAALVQPT